MKLKRKMKYVFSKHREVFIEFLLGEDKSWENQHGVIFEEFHPRDLPLLEDALKQRDFVSSFTIDEAIKQLQGRFLLFVAKQQNRIVGYDWYALDRHYIEFLDAALKLSPKEVYGTFSYFHRDFRGMGLLNGLHAYANFDLKRKGFTRVLGAYSPLNPSAERAFQKFGYRVIGDVTHGYVFTIRYFFNRIPKEKLTFEPDPFALWKRAGRKLNRWLSGSELDKDLTGKIPLTNRAEHGK